MQEGGGKWEESFEWQVHRQMEKPELEGTGKVSKNVTKIPETIKSIRTKKRAELLPLRVIWKIKPGHVNMRNL